MSRSELRGAHLYLDCFSGIAGDMMLGALLDLGVPASVVTDAISGLDLPGVELQISTVRRAGLAGTKVDVHHHGTATGAAHGPVLERPHHTHHTHHAFRVIRALIEARCSPAVAGLALSVFDAVAEVEARRHGVVVDDVVLHELGAVDSIVDIVGCAAALAWLSPCGVSSRVVPVGGGTVHTAHGWLPVPAPATLELLRGAELEAGGDSELTTPTGAALIHCLVTSPSSRGARFGPMPSGRVLGIGWGAGTRDPADRPNLLRVTALELTSVAEASGVEVLEANIDDLSPVLAAPLIEALMSAGALDAWFTPIVMKKGRPALMVSALVAPADRDAVEEIFFRESTTIGLRRSRWERTVLDRDVVEVETELGPIAVKLAGRRRPDGELDPLYTATPELEACRKLATAQGIPLRRVYEVAAAAAARRRRI